MTAIRINYKDGFKQLRNGSAWNVNVGMYLEDGTIEEVKWLGFIERKFAKVRPNAIPVNLDIDSYSYENMPQNWIDVPSYCAVWGCLLPEGVMAVTEGGKFRVVPKM